MQHTFFSSLPKLSRIPCNHSHSHSLTSVPPSLTHTHARAHTKANTLKSQPKKTNNKIYHQQTHHHKPKPKLTTWLAPPHPPTHPLPTNLTTHNYLTNNNNTTTTQKLSQHSTSTHQHPPLQIQHIPPPDCCYVYAHFFTSLSQDCDHSVVVDDDQQLDVLTMQAMLLQRQERGMLCSRKKRFARGLVRADEEEIVVMARW